MPPDSDNGATALPDGTASAAEPSPAAQSAQDTAAPTPDRPPVAPAPTSAPVTPLPGIDPALLEQRGLEGLEWPALLEALRGKVSTEAGLAELEALAPLRPLGAIRHALQAVSEMRALIEQSGPLPLGGLPTLTPLLDRAQREGRLEGVELLSVLRMQRGAEAVRSGLRAHPDAPHLVEFADALLGDSALAATLESALLPGGELNERTYPQLSKLRRGIDQSREAIHRGLDRVLRASGWQDALQDALYTLRGHRYVVPIKADFKGQVPGIVHDVSASGATLYVEPQGVVEDTNALMVQLKALEAETERILSELSALVGQAAPWLRENQQWIGRVDLLHAKAQFSRAMQGSAPQVEASGAIHLKGVAHPLLLLAGERVVRNTLHLDREAPCLVISGANTGGKTVLLKSVGLCALLVRHGLHIPAQPGSRMDAFDAVWADIGDQQNLEASLSSFSARIAFLAGMLQRVGENSLVLLDEILTGTEPQEGAALAAAVLEHLAERHIFCLATTHYGELKHRAAEHPAMLNASVAFDVERLAPTYRLIQGLPGTSYAFSIARRHGLPEALAAKAEASLAGRPAVVEALLFQVQEAERTLNTAQADHAKLAAQLEQRLAEAAHREQRQAERERELRRRERGAIGKDLEAARGRIAGVIRELQQANSLATVNSVRERLAALGGELTQSERPDLPVLEREVLLALAPGSWVHVLSLGRNAELEALLDGGARARVRMGNMALEVEGQDLAMAPAPPPPPPAKVAAPEQVAEEGLSRRAKRRQRSRGGGTKPWQQQGAAGGEGEPAENSAPGGVRLTLPTSENTVDLRGLRVDEALEKIDLFFDQCVMKRISPAVVIHGHGTGKLKAAIRSRLVDNAYVEAFRPGEHGEGRDGVTVVSLIA